MAERRIEPRQKTEAELEAELRALEADQSEPDATLAGRAAEHHDHEDDNHHVPGEEDRLAGGDNDDDDLQLHAQASRFGDINFLVIVTFLAKTLGPVAVATLIEMFMLGKFNGTPTCFQPMNNGTLGNNTFAPNNTFTPCPTVLATNGTAINGTATDPLFSAFGFDMSVVNLVAIPSGMLVIYAIYMLQSFLRHRAENEDAGHNSPILHSGERSALAKTGIDAFKHLLPYTVTTVSALAAKSALDTADFFASRTSHPNIGSFQTRLIWTTPIVELGAALLYIALVEGFGRMPKPRFCDRRAGADRDVDAVRSIHRADSLSISREPSRMEPLYRCWHAMFKCCEPKDEGSTMLRRGASYRSSGQQNGGASYLPLQHN